nr:immunoglobulin heavy chain junction region [Macaca mulatta]
CARLGWGATAPPWTNDW